MRALILAAGFGNRLRPLTNRSAKPAIWFFDKPVIFGCLNSLYQSGIRDVYINTHHQPGSVRRHLRRCIPTDMNVEFSFEPKILGTAGALIPLRKKLEDEPFFVFNGDVITDIDLSLVKQMHREDGNTATLVIHPPSRYLGFPLLGGDDSRGLVKFPGITFDKTQPTIEGTFTGIQILNPSIFKFLDSSGFQSITTKLYPKLIRSDQSVGVYRFDEYWNDIGTLNQYMKAHWDALSGRIKASYLFDRTNDYISEELNQYVASSARIGNHVNLGRNVVIGKNARVSDNVTLENAIVWPGVKIENNTDAINGVYYDTNCFEKVNELNDDSL